MRNYFNAQAHLEIANQTLRASNYDLAEDIRMCLTMHNSHFKDLQALESHNQRLKARIEELESQVLKVGAPKSLVSKVQKQLISNRQIEYRSVYPYPKELDPIDTKKMLRLINKLCENRPSGEMSPPATNENRMET